MSRLSNLFNPRAANLRLRYAPRNASPSNLPNLAITPEPSYTPNHSLHPHYPSTVDTHSRTLSSLTYSATGTHPLTILTFVTPVLSIHIYLHCPLKNKTINFSILFLDQRPWCELMMGKEVASLESQGDRRKIRDKWKARKLRRYGTVMGLWIGIA